MDDKELYASFFLSKAGISKLDVLIIISHGISSVAVPAVKQEAEEIPSDKTGKDFLSRFR